MKKNVIISIAIVLLVSLLIVCASPYYFLFGEVVEANGDTIVIEDYNGDVWEVLADDFKVGDKVGLAVNDSRTNIQKDDIVENIWRA